MHARLILLTLFTAPAILLAMMTYTYSGKINIFFALCSLAGLIGIFETVRAFDRVRLQKGNLVLRQMLGKQNHLALTKYLVGKNSIFTCAENSSER
jgi:hypothetical protein